MNRIAALALLTAGIGAIVILSPRTSRADSTIHTGTVERVWEDGFRLQTEDRNLRIDAWNVYGDHTPNEVQVGDVITVTGEFEGLEFDALSITNAD